MMIHCIRFFVFHSRLRQEVSKYKGKEFNPMQYFDKNGNEIKAGMKILMDDGSIELVCDTDDQYGNPSLGINASNEEFLKRHPNWSREYYGLSNFNPSSIEICPSEQEIRDELEKLTPIIEGTEIRLDYGEKVSKEDYEKYEAAIARRTTLTTMLGEDNPKEEREFIFEPKHIAVFLKIGRRPNSTNK